MLQILTDHDVSLHLNLNSLHNENDSLESTFLIPCLCVCADMVECPASTAESLTNPSQVTPEIFSEGISDLWRFWPQKHCLFTPESRTQSPALNLSVMRLD